MSKANALLTGRVTAEDFGDRYTLALAFEAEAIEAAEAAAGTFGGDLIRGTEAWSLATLRGTAKRYAGRYAAKRTAVFTALDRADIPWCEVRLPRGGRRCVVIGLDDAEVAR